MRAEFAIERSIRASREEVWSALLSLMNGPNGQPQYLVEGDPPPHGVGARKELQLLDRRMVEETTEFVPPKLRRYRMIEGLPVASYRACVVLDEQRGSTRLRWTGEVEDADADEARDFANRARDLLEVAVRMVAEAAEGASP